mgnify:CR=1 FL=1
MKAAYTVYDFKKVMSLLINFCGVDLSAVYFDIRKDSLYCDPRFDTMDAWDAATAHFGNRRRAARTVMAAVLERLLTWLAPVMPFTMEEAFLESPFRDKVDSVHLLLFPETPEGWKDDELAARWAKIFTVRRVVTGALEVERREKRIGASLEAAPLVHIADETLVEAFKASAKHNKTRARCKLSDTLLCQWFAPRGHIDERATRPHIRGSHTVDCFCGHIRF